MQEHCQIENQTRAEGLLELLLLPEGTSCIHSGCGVARKRARMLLSLDFPVRAAQAKPEAKNPDRRHRLRGKLPPVWLPRKRPI